VGAQPLAAGLGQRGHHADGRRVPLLLTAEYLQNHAPGHGDFKEDILAQATFAIDEADLVLFVVDGKEELSESDYRIRDLLLKNQKDVIVVVNKIDNEKRKEEIYRFYELGFEKIVAVSAAHKIGLKELLLEITNDVKVGTIFTSDVFYKDREALVEVSKLDVLGVEMETNALYINALMSGKNALAIFTVSDNPILGESIDSNEREKGLNQMIELALELAIKCEKEDMV